MTPNEKQLKLQVLELTLENLKLQNTLKAVQVALLEPATNVLQTPPETDSGDSNFI